MSKIKNMASTLGGKLIIWLLAALIVLLGASTFVISSIVKNTYNSTVMNDIGVNINISERLVTNYTDAIKEKLLMEIQIFTTMYPCEYSIDRENTIKLPNYDAPRLMKGDTLLNDKLDEIRRIVASTGMHLTFFAYEKDKGMFRNLLTSMDVSPEIYGRQLFVSPQYMPKLMKGEHVFYTLVLDGRLLISIAYPLTDKSGEVIGLIASSAPLSIAINALEKDFQRITIGGTGYLYLIGVPKDSAKQGDPVLLIHPTMKGENAYNIKDAEGNAFVKTMVEQKNGTLVYDFQPADSSKFEQRVAIYKHIPELDWIVAGSIDMDEINVISDNVRRTMFIIIIITIIILVITIRVFVGKVVSGPVSNINKRLKDIAAGDLSSNINVHSKDELGMLSTGLNETIDGLNDVLSLLKNAASEVYESANAVGIANEEMAKGAEHQSESTITMSTTIENMGESLHSLASQMDSTTEELNGIRENAETGGVVLKTAVDDISKLSESVVKTASNINELAESSSKISTVLQVINDIADQTNLLALNAAIEAARAGEAGRGFAVVADEVRKLAEKTMQATQEIFSTVNEIQSNMKAATDEMNNGVSLAKTGQDSTERLNDEISQILERIVAVSDKVTSMARLVEKQSEATDDVTTHVTNVAGAANENSVLANENMDKVDNLKDLSQTLIQRVSTFKLKAK